LRDRLTPEQEADRIRQTAQAIQNRLHEEEKLEEDARHLVAFGDFILNEVQAARELSRRISADDLRKYVTSFCSENYPGSEFRQDPSDLTRFTAKLSAQARNDLDSFVRRHGLVGQTQLTWSDASVRFENTVLINKERGLEIINQLHPIVRFVGERLTDSGALRPPAVAIRLSSNLCEDLSSGVYVFAVQRWTVRGVQDMERLYYTAVRLDGNEESINPELAERLVTLAANQGTDWLNAPDRVDFGTAAHLANEVCLAEADKEYDSFVYDLQAQNDDRADIQQRSAEAHFRARSDTLTNVRDRHVRAGRHGLARATEAQIEALKRWVERERARITERRRMTQRKDEICVGLILLE
jgi:hypothetical protein